MFDFAGINWIAVLVGVIASNALGFLWYGPLFGNMWLRMIGKTADEIEGSSSMYLVTALASAVAMIGLSLVVSAFGAGSFVDGLLVGVVAYIGLSGPATFVYTNFEGPSPSVWLLYSVYQIIVYAVMGGVFAVWA